MDSFSSSQLSPFAFCIVILTQAITSDAKATRYPPGVKPPQFEFDVFNIKTPQFIGIVFGVLVFTLTIMTVVMLMYKSGTLSRFQSEIQSGAPLRINLGDKTSVTPQTSSQPELYDHLIEATEQLPLTLRVPLLKGKLIELREYDENLDLDHLLEASNGQACFHESSYDPSRIWGWLPNFSSSLPSQDRATLAKCLASSKEEHHSHLVIVDPTLKRAVGMLSLVDNSTKNLSVRIENLWLTPAYQGKKFGHEAILLTLGHLVELGYRRVTAEVDTRHLIARKFLERCGFKIEGILRKHRIINKKNRDSALFVFLNSDWLDVMVKLKRLLGIDLKPKTKKVAEVDQPDNLFGRAKTERGEQESGTDAQKKKKTKKMKKKK
eukprot:CAMPEP_0114450412 /NCGR_PEP_ID=MMETSP0104-20121206/446_1 /TAXON_ID=37642 ORGANISM="Paraphysomonas imperforata, Strain PA2" /NCGR_SAMPLE_ID=MMETSP0104 /ASSEMBLY_ACC=CAM_ASM_000202 /LENGTH=378 /DNA_ID=CAMNT_0001622551 /DNA_START=1 /DNA_END=1137 /DNA_ORIENTATION=+